MCFPKAILEVFELTACWSSHPTLCQHRGKSQQELFYVCLASFYTESGLGLLLGEGGGGSRSRSWGGQRSEDSRASPPICQPQLPNNLFLVSRPGVAVWCPPLPLAPTLPLPWAVNHSRGVVWWTEVGVLASELSHECEEQR